MRNKRIDCTKKLNHRFNNSLQTAVAAVLPRFDDEREFPGKIDFGFAENESA